jgi:hypothetical protein
MNYDVIDKFFLLWDNLVSDIPAGDGNIEKLFLRCCYHHYLLEGETDVGWIHFVFFFVHVAVFLLWECSTIQRSSLYSSLV